MVDQNYSTNQTEKDLFYKEKKKEEMKHQVVTFAMMIIFTLIAFGIVMADVSKMFTIPIIIVLAIVQVGFQFFYFMHMSNEGHTWPVTMIFSGIFAAFLTVLALTTIVWWG
ncbi:MULTISPECIES: cytochrome c oxidase subunit IVB [Allobacillus]|uniref:Cytochrome c oxidase subunit IVB n=1 Tax=Allobacillus halotolerans TaxID=570278 RepID=A0ABS6GPC7_9BACI|nr:MULTISPECIES: cytochrome c oxidase subunit IVB [Allobacillus]MBU6080499.1 cytochrome c oxidase subunit IVB [Allobacillus halotolerans]TSJ69349.1 cytochrome c oxidase subunit IVB [Allobacillus sp. SKP2-8]